MNVQAIDPISARNSAQPTAAASPPPRKAAPAPQAAPVTVAALTTPAATATVTSVPATVKPEDRALYVQILKSLGGNVNAALAALAAFQSKEARA
jgi:hypothetical protein